MSSKFCSNSATIIFKKNFTKVRSAHVGVQGRAKEPSVATRGDQLWPSEGASGGRAKAAADWGHGGRRAAVVVQPYVGGGSRLPASTVGQQGRGEGRPGEGRWGSPHGGVDGAGRLGAAMRWSWPRVRRGQGGGAGRAEQAEGVTVRRVTHGLPRVTRTHLRAPRLLKAHFIFLEI